MAHQLTEIRTAAVTLLRQRFQRVYTNRAIAPAQSQLPCVVVYIDGRNSETATLDASVFRHVVRLNVLVCVQAGEAADALAEEMLGIIEHLFAEHPALAQKDLVIESLMPSTLKIEYDDTGEAVTTYYRQMWHAIVFEYRD